MRLEDFDFELPTELIALRPKKPRTSAKLLVATDKSIDDYLVNDLAHLLRSGDRLVLNNTKVIPARLSGTRIRKIDPNNVAKAKINVNLIERKASDTWIALVKPLRKLNLGEFLDFGNDLKAQLIDKQNSTAKFLFNKKGQELEESLSTVGSMPLPPYIANKRPVDVRDDVDYQAIWAEEAGSVAAPTASLHFDKQLLLKLKEIGVRITFVTLHVGAGTFLPVKVDKISEHKMHPEIGYISEAAALEINETKSQGNRVIPVGTTALRLIESAAGEYGLINEWSGETDIFIYPGFQFKISDGLVTNFHLPKSTLLMLVSALMGSDRVRKIYAHAIKKSYRFFSYGDASLLLKKL
jgi:S-adenosylmethionine:tRNA ribosyltransferase-isomerase